MNPISPANSRFSNGVFSLFGISLLDAVKEGQVDVVKTLLDAGEDVNAFGEEDETLLMMAIRKNHTNVALLLIESMNLDSLNVRDQSKQTALNYAVFQRNTAVVKALLKYEIDLNIAEERTEFTPLISAIREGSTDIAIALIEKITSQDLFVRDERGSTALDYAISTEQEKIVQALFSRVQGQFINQLKSKGKINNDQKKILLELFNQGAKGIIDGLNITQLRSAAEQSKTEVASNLKNLFKIEVLKQELRGSRYVYFLNIEYFLGLIDPQAF